MRGNAGNVGHAPLKYVRKAEYFLIERPSWPRKRANCFVPTKFGKLAFPYCSGDILIKRKRGGVFCSKQLAGASKPTSAG